MKKVVKFGGSSLANAQQFMKVGDIIRKDEPEDMLCQAPRAKDMLKMLK